MKIPVKRSLQIGSLAMFLGACGSAPQNSDIKITNGSEIKETEEPGVVMLYDKSKGAMCAGSFIDDQTVVTAANCTMSGKVENSKTGRVNLTLSLVRPVEGKKLEFVADSIEVYRNPMWDDEFERQQANMYDLGVVRFPAKTAVEFKKISSVGAKRGDEVSMVGYGLNYLPKRGETPNPESAGVKRVGYNKIDMTGQGFLYSYGQTDSTDASGQNANAAPGDSGAPLFLEGQLVGITIGGGRVLGRGISLYVDLHSKTSKAFMKNLGYDY